MQSVFIASHYIFSPTTSWSLKLTVELRALPAENSHKRFFVSMVLLLHSSRDFAFA